MSDNNPSEKQFSPGQKVWYSQQGHKLSAKVVKMSASGKRVRVRYEYSIGGVNYQSGVYVDVKNVEPRV